MSRSSFDYDFNGCVKPCTGRQGRKISLKRENDCLGNNCQWYEMCDLSIKDPPGEPTLPKRGRCIC